MGLGFGRIDSPCIFVFTCNIPNALSEHPACRPDSRVRQREDIRDQVPVRGCAGGTERYTVPPLIHENGNAARCRATALGNLSPKIQTKLSRGGPYNFGEYLSW